jgi:hypothetical protein
MDRRPIQRKYNFVWTLMINFVRLIILNEAAGNSTAGNSGTRTLPQMFELSLGSSCDHVDMAARSH